MIAAVVLAACASVPLFDMDGPTCPAERIQLQCECSECMDWDPVAGVDLYELQRETVSTGTLVGVGEVSWKFGETVAEAWIPRLWCFAWDSPFPRDNTLYRYRVRACRVESSGRVCSPEWSDPVEYRAAPYACYDGGQEVQCYTGDDIARVP